MVLIRKDRGGSGVGLYWWENDGDVVDVVDIQIAEELLCHPGFVDVSVLQSTGVSESTLDQAEKDETVAVPEEDNARPVGNPDDITGTGSGTHINLDITGDPEKILEWVDASKERAEAALKAERRKGFGARKPLVEELKKIVEA